MVVVPAGVGVTASLETDGYVSGHVVMTVYLPSGNSLSRSIDRESTVFAATAIDCSRGGIPYRPTSRVSRPCGGEGGEGEAMRRPNISPNIMATADVLASPAGSDGARTGSTVIVRITVDVVSTSVAVLPVAVELDPGLKDARSTSSRLAAVAVVAAALAVLLFVGAGTAAAVTVFVRPSVFVLISFTVIVAVVGVATKTVVVVWGGFSCKVMLFTNPGRTTPAAHIVAKDNR